MVDEKVIRYTFRNEDKILKRSEFLFINDSGKKVQNEKFIAIFCPCRFGRTRLGITVSKRVGNAVTRNKVKRLIREYFRLNRNHQQGCNDIHIIAKKHAANISSDEAFLSLDNLFNKISKN